MLKKVLLEFESSKHLVSFESSPMRCDVNQVLDEIKRLSSRNRYLGRKIGGNNTLILQQFTEEFDGCYVDVDDEAEIPNGARLKLVVEEAENGNIWHDNLESRRHGCGDKLESERRDLRSSPGGSRNNFGEPDLPIFGAHRHEDMDDSSNRRSLQFNELHSDRFGPHFGSDRFERSFDSPGPLFDRPEPLFDRPEPLFDRPGPLFDRPGPLFDRSRSMLDRPGSLLDRPLSLLGGPLSSFDCPEPLFDRRGPMFDRPGPMFDRPGPMFDSPKRMSDHMDDFDRNDFGGNMRGSGRRSFTGRSNNDKYTWREIMEWEEEELGFAGREPPQVRKVFDAAYNLDNTSKQPVQLLNEVAQRESWPLPKFELVIDGTNTTNPTFKFQVKVNDKTYEADRYSLNKKQAKVYAALKALYILKELF